MNKSCVVAAFTAGTLCVAAAARAAPVETGWVQFDLRREAGYTYVYPRLAGASPGRVFSGNCQFNALVVPATSDPRLDDMLRTAMEQRLRVSLWYDDTDGPMCHVAYLNIEWAD